MEYDILFRQNQSSLTMSKTLRDEPKHFKGRDAPIFAEIRVHTLTHPISVTFFGNHVNEVRTSSAGPAPEMGGLPEPHVELSGDPTQHVILDSVERRVTFRDIHPARTSKQVSHGCAKR